MPHLAALLAFGVTFLVVRLGTIALFEMISPPVPNASRWSWWCTYVSILLSLGIATAVLAAVDLRMGGKSRRP